MGLPHAYTSFTSNNYHDRSMMKSIIMCLYAMWVDIAEMGGECGTVDARN
jgi:hypothetical protein